MFLKEYYRKSRMSESTSKNVEINSNRKSIEDLKKSWNVDKDRLGKLPEAVQERYRLAKEAGHFED